MLSLRILSGVVLVPILVGLVILGEPWYTMAVSLAVLLGVLEMSSLIRSAGYQPFVPCMILLGLAFPLDATGVFGNIIAGVIAVTVIVSLLVLMARPASERAIHDWALTLTPPLYIGGLLQYFIPLRAGPDGPLWPLMVLGLSWICDITAFTVGRLAGRTRLAPRLSPSKTVEGAVAGILASIIGAGAVAMFLGRPVPHLLVFGALMGIATVVGDLMESFVKRQVGAKDSGILIPGHGGILDRMDSLLLAAVAAYGYQVLTHWGARV